MGMHTSVARPGSKVTSACSRDRDTFALCTPPKAPSAFSRALEQDAQVMPVMRRVATCTPGLGHGQQIGNGCPAIHWQCHGP